ncbi:MAG: hypothetical protein ABL308_12720 [Oceanicaulis sp.]
MNSNLPPSDKVAVVGAASPAVGTSAISTGWIEAKNFYQFVAVVLAGALGSDATFDAKLEQATDNTGTGAKDVTGKSITQLTQAGTDDSNKQALIELSPDELDVANGFGHFRLTVTPAVANSGAAGIVLGLEPRYAPASGFDAASVAEIVG